MSSIVKINIVGCGRSNAPVLLFFVRTISWNAKASYDTGPYAGLTASPQPRVASCWPHCIPATTSSLMLASLTPTIPCVPPGAGLSRPALFIRYASIECPCERRDCEPPTTTMVHLVFSISVCGFLSFTAASTGQLILESFVASGT